LLEDRL